MSLLHDHLNARNLRAFQSALDGSAPAKSWNRGFIGTPSFDVNSRDWLGRTPLHLACASVECIDYVRALLRHPHIDVNVLDAESLWTPLHRALYSANISAAVILLQHPDIDTSLKDLEGYTAFDLYNSTLNGTKPGIGDAELYTWGTNRNAALGLGDADDRTYAELVYIKSKEEATKTDISSRFSSVYVREMRMSRLHTAIVTNDSEGNVQLCGFGSGGRLGSSHTQFTFKPLLSLNLPILSVAVGQDHTLALTKSGEVYSWGLNRFSQLGFVVEVPNTASNRLEEPIQHVPKKVVGLLKKEVVLGVAASKNASACWTKGGVFTWGTNLGQLGYDKNAQPVQVLPRAVTKFKYPAIELALSDNVLVALLVTRQVECIWNDRHIRILFSMHPFPITIQPYRPPQCVKDAHIVKITCCDDNFAALSSNGEVFTFAPNPPVGSDVPPGPIFKPQKVWSLRKKFSAVKDVALGSDGTMIVCTESGHVYIRTRSIKSSSNKGFRCDRIPFLQRVSHVCANSTGAFAALRVDHQPCPIVPTGNIIAQDLKTLQPYLPFYRPHAPPKAEICRHMTIDDEEPDDLGIERDIDNTLELLRVLAGERQLCAAGHGSVNCDGIRLPLDADVLVHLQSGQIFPVHRVILAARSPVLESFFSGSLPLEDSRSRISLRLLPAKPGSGLGVRKLTCFKIDRCHPLTVLIFLRYLYSDELIAIWDRRIGVVMQEELTSNGLDPAQVKLELQGLARIFGLPALSQVLEHAVKHDPLPTMGHDMQRLFDTVQCPLPAGSPLAPDVVIQLADKEVYTHSVLLRSRTPLFASFFDLEDWTVKRWEADGIIRINMTHLDWHVMRFVFSFMCCGSDREIFNTLEFIESVEDLIRFMFSVAAAANELLLERLVLICASVILARCSLYNACSILEDATYYHIVPLIERLQEYIAINMEAFLQGHMLDEISGILVQKLAQFVRARQLEKSPFSRSGVFVNQLLAKHAEWLAEQDIPGNIIRTASTGPLKADGLGNRVFAAMPGKTTSKFPITTKIALASQSSSNILRRPPSGDDIFIMDPESTGHPASYKEPAVLATPPMPPSIWKPTSSLRVDMKQIMAETQAASRVQSALPSSSSGVSQPSRPLPMRRTPQSFGESSSASKSLSALGSSPARKANVDQSGGHFPPSGMSSALSSAVALNGTPTSSAVNAARPVHLPRVTPPRGSGLGPVIAAKRPSQPNAISSNIRKGGSGGNAWSHLPEQPAAKSAPATGMSFVAIQDSQKQAQPVKDVQSFREIQEEEQSLQIEADFLKWWTAEEERIRLEALALTEFENSLNKQSNPSHKKARSRRKGKGTEARGNPMLDASVGESSLEQNNPGGPSEPLRARIAHKPS